MRTGDRFHYWTDSVLVGRFQNRKNQKQLFFFFVLNRKKTEEDNHYFPYDLIQLEAQ